MDETTKQYLWQQTKRSQGLCTICGKRKLNYYAYRCDKCHERLRKSLRKKLGHKPYRKGRRGRPPRAKELDWEVVDWSLQNKEIARRMGVSSSAVRKRRKKMQS